MNNYYNLKYGLNPHQSNAHIIIESEGNLPFKVLNGTPSYINFLDALNSFQLVNQIKKSIGQVAAASFKHVSPAGVGLGRTLSSEDKKAFFIEENREYNELSCAYLRARQCDPVSSFGEFIALNEKVDVETAKIIEKEVSDGIIAPGYDDAALAILRNKRKGKYIIIEMDVNYEPKFSEKRDIFGLMFEQERNNIDINKSILNNIVTGESKLNDNIIQDSILSLITLKYTQSNSTCFAFNGQTIGIGAGQQSRIHCTRIASNKSEEWLLKRHPKFLEAKFKKGLSRTELYNAVDLCLNYTSITKFEKDYLSLILDGHIPTINENEKNDWIKENYSNIVYASDGFIPFRDNIDRAVLTGAKYIIQPGGSIRDEEVIKAAEELGVTMIFTGMRLFTH